MKNLVSGLLIAFTAAALIYSSVASARHHRNLEAEVIAVAEEYGNIDLSANAASLTELGLSKGDTFPVGFGDKEVMVYLGDTYSDVPRGEWIAFITSDGNIRLARNFENAAATLGVTVGDTVTLYN